MTGPLGTRIGPWSPRTTSPCALTSCPLDAAMEISISGVKGLLGGLNFEECVPFDCKIKRIAGLLGAARAEIETSSSQNAEIIDLPGLKIRRWRALP